MFLTRHMAIGQTILRCCRACAALVIVASCGTYYSTGASSKDKTKDDLAVAIPLGDCKTELSISEGRNGAKTTYNIHLSFNHTSQCRIKLSNVQVAFSDLKMHKGKFRLEKVSLYKYVHGEMYNQEEIITAPVITFTVTDHFRTLVYTYTYEGKRKPSKKLQATVKGRYQTDSTTETFSGSAAFKKKHYFYMN